MLVTNEAVAGIRAPHLDDAEFVELWNTMTSLDRPIPPGQEKQQGLPRPVSQADGASLYVVRRQTVDLIMATLPEDPSRLVLFSVKRRPDPARTSEWADAGGTRKSWWAKRFA